MSEKRPKVRVVKFPAAIVVAGDTYYVKEYIKQLRERLRVEWDPSYGVWFVYGNPEEATEMVKKKLADIADVEVRESITYENWKSRRNEKKE